MLINRFFRTKIGGLPQFDNINFENTVTLYTKNIKVNDTETKYVAGVTNGLPLNSYTNQYVDDKKRITALF